jgi:hypothetical protein
MSYPGFGAAAALERSMRAYRGGTVYFDSGASDVAPAFCFCSAVTCTPPPPSPINCIKGPACQSDCYTQCMAAYRGIQTYESICSQDCNCCCYGTPCVPGTTSPPGCCAYQAGVPIQIGVPILG